MQVRNFLRNALGISMVEIMMAVAISGGLALTVAKLMENSSQSVKQVEAKNESIGLKNMMISNYSNPTACFNTFNPIINAANITTLSGSTTAAVTVPSVKDKGNMTLWDTSSTNIRPLTITSMRLTNWSTANSNADFVVNLTFRRSSSQVQAVKPIKIKINFNITGSALVSCSPMEAGGGEWLLTGNAGTVDGTDFLGTSDNQPLNFRVNGVESGRIDSVGSTFFGYEAGSAITTGSANTVMGHQAMRANQTGTGNTVVGRQAAILTTAGAYNTIMGFRAGGGLTSGSQNILIGSSAGSSITAGQNNIAIGTGAGANVFAGSNSILIGNGAGATYAAAGNKLAIEGIVGNNPLIGGDFSARTVNLAGTTTFDVGSYGVAMRLPQFSAIRTTTAAASDRVYFDARTLFRDGASTGTGFVGIAGGLGIGSGTYWDGSVVPAQGNVNIEGRVSIGVQNGTNAKLTVEGEGSTANTTIRAISTPGGSSGQAVYGHVTPVSDNGSYIGTYGVCSNSAGTVQSYCIGVQGHAQYLSGQTMGRTYGVRGIAGNGTAGWNYGIYGVINSTATTMGAGVYGSSFGPGSDIDMSSFSASTVAGFFQGRVYVKGPLTADSYANNSDRRLKKDIKPIKNSLEKISQINGVSYYWKNDPQAGEQGKEQIGLIAQDVEKVFPQVVQTTKNAKGIETKSLLYGQLVSPIIEAIKELYQMVLNLIKTDSRHDEEIKKLKAENEKLKQQMKLQQESFDERMKKLEAQMNQKKK